MIAPAGLAVRPSRLALLERALERLKPNLEFAILDHLRKDAEQMHQPAQQSRVELTPLPLPVQSRQLQPDAFDGPERPWGGGLHNILVSHHFRQLDGSFVGDNKRS
jgi:hypothetical protein